MNDPARCAQVADKEPFGKIATATRFLDGFEIRVSIGLPR